jgi:L-seryl-tRNA(Ser) seleniumtransferase
MPPHVVNATGVILHTNLGRAPWPRAARVAAGAAARSYGYLELDEATGRRGRRFHVAEDHLRALTGAEDALVVTNNAAALALAVGLAGRRGAVVVSRGELVEIGGGVRIPDVIGRTGVRLVEVGTTSRTQAADFEGHGRAARRGRAPGPPLELLGQRVHGGRGSGGVAAIAIATARSSSTTSGRARCSARLPSGLPTSRCPPSGWRPARTWSVQRRQARRWAPVGADRRPGRSRRDCGAIRWPARSDRKGDPRRRRGGARDLPPVGRAGIPSGSSWGGTSTSTAAARGSDLTATNAARVIELDSTVGGGSLPGQTLPSAGVAVRVASPTRALARLRSGPDRVLARIVDDEVAFDLRTVEPFEDGLIARRIGELAAGRCRRHRHRRPMTMQDDAAPGLTGIDSDRLPRRSRGMTSTSGTPTCSTTARIDFVDVPGHDRLVGNMLVGAGRSTRRWSSSRPTTGRGPRRSSTCSCSTGLSPTAWSSRGRRGQPARVEEVTRAVRALDERRSGAPILTVSAASGQGLAGSGRARPAGPVTGHVGAGSEAPSASRSIASSRSGDAAPS